MERVCAHANSFLATKPAKAPHSQRLPWLGLETLHKASAKAAQALRTAEAANTVETPQAQMEQFLQAATEAVNDVEATRARSAAGMASPQAGTSSASSYMSEEQLQNKGKGKGSA